MAKYVSGTCNIGTANRLSRFLVGVLLLGFSFLAFFWLKQNNYSNGFRLLLFFPLYGGFLGIVQAALGFCVLTAKEKKFDLR